MGEVEHAKKAVFRALQLTRGIQDTEHQSQVLANLAQVMAKLGKFQKALEAIKNTRSRDFLRALESITQEMARAKVQENSLWKQVFEMAEKSFVSNQAKSFAFLAKALAKIDLVEAAEYVLDKAVQAAGSIRDSETHEKVSRWDSLKAIGSAMAESGINNPWL